MALRVDELCLGGIKYFVMMVAEADRNRLIKEKMGRFNLLIWAYAHHRIH